MQKRREEKRADRKRVKGKASERKGRRERKTDKKGERSIQIGDASGNRRNVD